MKQEVSRRKDRTVGRELWIVEERKARKRSPKNRSRELGARVLSSLHANKPTFIDFHARAKHICGCVFV